MSVIKPIGAVLPVDADGYLLNPCRFDLVVSPWKEAIADITSAYLNHLGEAAVHSLYLRGSVAKGTAIESVSDIDTFAVVNEEGTEIEKSWRKSFQTKMSKKYPFQMGIEIWCEPYDQLCHSPKAHSIRVMLKTQCLCLYGADLAPQLPRYKPGKDLITHSPTIQSDIQEVIELLPTYQDPQDVIDDCQWIMKRIVRTGFELAMEQENTYTRDLYPCYIAFGKHFSKRKGQMKQAFEWAIAPTTNSKALIPFLTNFKNWFAKTIPNSN